MGEEEGSELAEGSRTTGINQTPYQKGLTDVRHLYLGDEDVNQLLVGHGISSPLQNVGKRGYFSRKIWNIYMKTLFFNIATEHIAFTLLKG